MFAIRCRDGKRTFRRSGTAFSGSSWTLVEEPTPEQLAEPMLICEEVDRPDDPRLLGLLVEAAPDAPEVADAVETDHLRARIAELEAENAAIQQRLEALNAKSGKRAKSVESAASVPEANEAIPPPAAEPNAAPSAEVSETEPSLEPAAETEPSEAPAEAA